MTTATTRINKKLTQRFSHFCFFYKKPKKEQFKKVKILHTNLIVKTETTISIT